MNSETDAPEFDPFAQEPDQQEPRKSGNGPAWLALLLALAAAAFTGYQWWLDRQAGSEDTQQQAALRDLQNAQGSLERSLRALEERLALAERNDGSGAIAALDSGLDALQERVADMSLASADTRARFDAAEVAMLGLRERIVTAERSIAALAARGDSPAESLDLSEVEYLLRLASERLQLAGDPNSAGQALALADARLAAMDDPLYLPVRQRIAAARQTLADLPVPDRLDLTNRVAALQAGIAALPFPGDLPAEPTLQDAGEDQGLWARFKRSMAGLVTVRRRVPEEDVLLSLEDKDYLRQGLWLQLESARLAVMRADTLAWQTALQRAAETLAVRFEGSSPRVAEAVAEVRALSATPVAVDMPDISAPWAQLRLLSEGRAETVPEPADPPPAEVPDDAGADQPVAPEPVEGAGGG